MTAFEDRTRRADAQRNRARIVATATELLQQRGDAVVSLEEIARRAGVGSATLHRHFRGRDALLTAVFADTIARLAQDGMKIADTTPPRRALWIWLDQIVRHCADDRALLQMVSTDSGSPSWHDLEITGAHLLTLARADGAVNPAVGIADLLELVNAIAAAAAGQPERASRLLDIVREGAAGTR